MILRDRTERAAFLILAAPPNRHFERSRPTSLHRSRPPTVISNGAGRLPHPGRAPARHFERSRPTFSSAFSPANASAFAERNLSSLALSQLNPTFLRVTIRPHGAHLH